MSDDAQEAVPDRQPDHGERTYRGNGRLAGRAALITGADSGIGRAVAIAYAREGADVLVSYLDEEEDARETARWVEEAGRRAVLVPGDLADPAHCRAIVARALEAFGRLDVLVSNAGLQHVHGDLADVADDEWDRTLAVNLSAFFHLAKAAAPHLPRGGSIIVTSSVNGVRAPGNLLAYSATKAAQVNMAGALAQLLGPHGIRVNAVAPGAIWTPLIPATMPEAVDGYGEGSPLGRAGQPADLAGVYVLLAADEGAYISGSTIGVTGGTPLP